MNKVLADNRSVVVSTIRAAAQEQGTPEDIVRRVLDRLLPSIRLVPREGGAEPGRSRIGGLPDLPEGFPWPRVEFVDEESVPLAFILQVSLSEVAGLVPGGLLPTEGLLSVFFWPHYPFDIGEVLYFPPPGPPLRQASAPDDLPEEDRFNRLALRSQPEWTVPFYADLGLAEEAVVEAIDLDEVRERVAGAQGFGRERPIHRLLGHPELLQAGGLGEDDRLLIQVDSDAPGGGGLLKTGMRWGDLGRLFYFVLPCELQAWDLDRAFISLDSQ